ncbi:MAG: DNA polymerase III subunit gamma/tau, partial [Jatrophihabitans sp.]
WVRDSLSILYQLLAGAGDEGVTYKTAVGLLGVTDDALLDETIDALAAHDAPAVFRAVDRVVEAGHDPRRFSLDLLDRFRDLILLAAVPDAAERGLLDPPGDQLTRMLDQADRLGPATLTRFAEIVHAALIEMRGTTSPRLVLELLCARMLLPDATADAAALLQRLERLERRLTVAGGGAPVADERPVAASSARAAAPAARTPTATPSSAPAARPPAAPAEPPVAPAPPAAPSRAASDAPATQAAASPPAAPAASAPGGGAAAAGRAAGSRPAAREPRPAGPGAAGFTAAADTSPAPATPPPGGGAAGTLDATALRRIWPEVLEVVKQASRRTRALVDNAQIASVTGDTVKLEAPAALAKMIAEDSNTEVLRAALTKVVGGTWKIAVGAGGGAADTARPAATGAVRSAPVRELPPEPDPRDDLEPDDDGPPDERPVVDPEQEALRLLRDELGARPLDAS